MIFKHSSFLKIIIPLAVAALLITGCASRQNDNSSPTTTEQATESQAAETTKPSETANTEDAQKKAMDGFNALVAGKPAPQQLMKYIKENVAAVKPEDANAMLLKLEEVQKDGLKALDEKYFDSSIQKKMMDIWQKDFDINAVINSEDKELKALLEETRDGGYKVETAEGSFFPILDYSSYTGFSSYVTDDIKEFISIMATESGKVPAKDAALVISWEEVLDRALKQEKFLVDYPDSKKNADICQLYGKYLSFAFMGLNNTPAFSYESGEMEAELKDAYKKFMASSTDVKLGQRFRSFVEILEKSNYKLTKEIEEYRKTAIEVPLGC